jgi:hypothetical protein
MTKGYILSLSHCRCSHAAKPVSDPTSTQPVRQREQNAKIQVKTLTMTSEYFFFVLCSHVCVETRETHVWSTQTILSADRFYCPYNHPEMQILLVIFKLSFPDPFHSRNLSRSSQTPGTDSIRSEFTMHLKNARDSELAMRGGLDKIKLKFESNVLFQTKHLMQKTRTKLICVCQIECPNF